MPFVNSRVVAWLDSFPPSPLFLLPLHVFSVRYLVPTAASACWPLFQSLRRVVIIRLAIMDIAVKNIWRGLEKAQGVKSGIEESDVF